MDEKVKFDNIYEYANLKLYELETLNEIKIYIQEIYDLRNNGFVCGVDIDDELNNMKANYKELLKTTKNFS